MTTVNVTTADSNRQPVPMRLCWLGLGVVAWPLPAFWAGVRALLARGPRFCTPRLMSRPIPTGRPSLTRQFPRSWRFGLIGAARTRRDVGGGAGRRDPTARSLPVAPVPARVVDGTIRAGAEWVSAGAPRGVVIVAVMRSPAVPFPPFLTEFTLGASALCGSERRVTVAACNIAVRVGTRGPSLGAMFSNMLRRCRLRWVGRQSVAY